MDPHSYALPEEPLISHIDLSLFIDFPNRTILGSATLHLPYPYSGDLHLDTRSLLISSVTDSVGLPLPFRLSSAAAAAQPFLGHLLLLSLPSSSSSFTILYRTLSDSSALQWLSPSQTSGGTLPYLFTQCQPIHARSIFPCHDTPLARISYSAAVNVPDTMTVVMAAARVENGSAGALPLPCDEALWNAAGRSVQRFRMDHTIPPYLFAMAAGDIGRSEVGPRTAVYAEPRELEAAAREFAATEAMMQEAEKLFGAYEWERLDLVVMPPSFPYGGMENPRLVFLTPTVVVGDGSGLQVVAHELAHSWTGNLITNATNDHFWLNEGFATYAGRRIGEAIDGKERAQLNLGLGYSWLKKEMERFKDRPEFTKLRTDQRGVHPDEIYSQVPYEKGCQFLIRIETEVGRVAFDGFLKKYISTFRFTSITTETFLVFLKDHFPDIDKKVDLDQWIYQPGIPPDIVPPRSAILDKVLALAAGFGSGIRVTPDDVDCQSWQALEWHIYLENLPKKLSEDQIKELDEGFHFSESHSWEIKVAFFTIAAFSGYEPCFPAIEATLHAVGRMKFLRPLYSGLLQSTEEAKEIARRVFKEARSKYHPIAQSVVQGLMQKFDHQ